MLKRSLKAKGRRRVQFNPLKVHIGKSSLKQGGGSSCSRMLQPDGKSLYTLTEADERQMLERRTDGCGQLQLSGETSLQVLFIKVILFELDANASSSKPL